MPTAVACYSLFLLPFLCLSVFPHHIFKKDDTARITKHEIEMFHDVFWKPIYFGSKGQIWVNVTSHEKHCRRGPLHYCECWFLLVCPMTLLQSLWICLYCGCRKSDHFSIKAVVKATASCCVWCVIYKRWFTSALIPVSEVACHRRYLTLKMLIVRQFLVRLQCPLVWQSWKTWRSLKTGIWPGKCNEVNKSPRIVVEMSSSSGFKGKYCVFNYFVSSYVQTY